VGFICFPLVGSGQTDRWTDGQAEMHWGHLRHKRLWIQKMIRILPKSAVLMAGLQHPWADVRYWAKKKDRIPGPTASPVSTHFPPPVQHPPRPHGPLTLARPFCAGPISKTPAGKEAELPVHSRTAQRGLLAPSWALPTAIATPPQPRQASLVFTSPRPADWEGRASVLDQEPSPHCRSAPPPASLGSLCVTFCVDSALP
jgi:hypothetical protein